MNLIKKVIYCPILAKRSTKMPKATNQSAEGCDDRALPIKPKQNTFF